MIDENKCGHDGCGCAVTGEAKYCCDYCREANSNDAITNPACDCRCDTCK